MYYLSAFKEQFAVTIETELKATAQIIHDKLSHSINEVVSGAQAEECGSERGKVFQISLTLLVDEAVKSIVDALRSRFAYFVDDHCSDYLLEMSKKDKEITKLKLQGRLFQDEMKTALQHIRQADSIFVQCLSRSTCDTRSNAAKEERDAGWLENRHSAMQFGGNQAMDEGEIFPSTKDELHTSNKQSEKMSKTVSIEDIHSGFFGITVTQNVKEHDALQIGDTDIYFPDPKQTEATAKESEHLKFCIKQEQLSACENNPLHINEEASEEAFVKVKEEDVEQDIDQTTEQNLNASNYSGATELENLELRHSFSQGNSLLSDNDNLEFQEREKSNEIVTTMPQENISVTSQHTASEIQQMGLMTDGLYKPCSQDDFKNECNGDTDNGKCMVNSLFDPGTQLDFKCSALPVVKLTRVDALWKTPQKCHNDTVNNVNKLHNCAECGKSYKKKIRFEEHQRIHTGEKPHVCRYCGKSFRKLISFKRHTLTHKGEKPYCCNVCKKRFRKKSRFQEHHRIHTGEKKYVCSKCGKQFRLKSSIQEHLNIHSGEKPYSCPKCEKSFKKRKNLLTHQILHTGEKPFDCPDCGKTFRKKKCLQKHQAIHNEENPVDCAVCGEKFSKKKLLQTHLRFHSEDKLFSCSIYSKKFLTMETLHVCNVCEEKSKHDAHSRAENPFCFTEK
ncbi:zinc finger protein with KRAB and SCAN domains 7-like isoform X2 [Polypterus senegalus]|uniref:zinc finger protein with KRAB and SCAN domains 7-like isoform X2 n=1 Tax=Polypterus senegalus TaxID=55291 RepID=UPI0019624855|nr:zinc finger protein with KRAB and SCAN domains 7-like isoform X2 [Polypterus senegalus]